jgi:hypothetical protein
MWLADARPGHVAACSSSELGGRLKSRSVSWTEKADIQREMDERKTGDIASL